MAEVYLEDGIAMIEVYGSDKTMAYVLRVDDLIKYVTVAIEEITRPRENRIVDLSRFDPPDS
jgi:hypothetical protein